MRLRKAWTIVAVVAVAAALAAGAAGAETLTLEIEPTAAIVRSATPGGPVVVFSLSSEWAGYSRHLARRAELLDDLDGDGSVALALDEPAVPTSVWAAVDLTTGALATAVPEGSRVTEVAPPAVGAFGGETELEVASAALEVWLVRSGEAEVRGAWLAALGDGARDDLDGEVDGRLRFSPSRFHPVGRSAPPPLAWAEGDVLVAVDTETLDHWVLVAGEEVR